jgi:pimeloyl-ACP methyl ester carboxylesterase
MRQRWLVLLLTGLLGACSSLDAWQREKLYRPARVADAAEWQRLLAQRPELEAITVPAGDAGEQVQVLRWPALAGQQSPVRVLYLHGTYRHAFQNLAKAAPMQRAGMDVYVLDYRGWGASTPRLPNETSIFADAWTTWQALQPAAGAAPVRWVVYGHSMGSGVAVRLAERLAGSRATCALVLESSFTSFPDVARAAAGWVGGLLAITSRERMASIDHISAVDPPVWFLHGSQDDTVPIALGRRLYEKAPSPKHWLEWPLGHSNLQTDPSGRYDAVWREIASSCRAEGPR